MSDANFSLIFEGSAVENGEMDVKDLAPSLLALGELIQAANAEINGEKARIGCQIAGNEEGIVRGQHDLGAVL